MGEAFEKRGLRHRRSHDGRLHALASLEGYDVLVILGSKCAVYDHEVEAAWFHRELALIGEADESVAADSRNLFRCAGALSLLRRYGHARQRR